MAKREGTPRDASAQDQLASMDKRIQARTLRARGKPFAEELGAAAARLPDLSNRLYSREGEEVDAFARDLANDKKLRDQRIARQLRGEARTPQAELLPGDTRD